MTQTTASILVAGGTITVLLLPTTATLLARQEATRPEKPEADRS
ncbi:MULTISPECIES: hypothetical protein [unclassified Mumia]|nr:MULTISPECIES: hypothetical protein [unclassified Mumia]MDD9347279.1 hypothetical protein [Mumia sp.]